MNATDYNQFELSVNEEITIFQNETSLSLWILEPDLSLELRVSKVLFFRYSLLICSVLRADYPVYYVIEFWCVLRIALALAARTHRWKHETWIEKASFFHLMWYAESERNHRN